MQGKLINFKTNSQCKKILDYLKTGESLTVMKALHLGFGANLRSRVSNLKDAGYDIKSELIKVDGTYVAEYKLNVDNRQVLSNLPSIPNSRVKRF